MNCQITEMFLRLAKFGMRLRITLEVDFSHGLMKITIMLNYCANKMPSQISQNMFSQKTGVTFVLISEVVLYINYHWVELICHLLISEERQVLCGAGILALYLH